MQFTRYLNDEGFLISSASCGSTFYISAFLTRMKFDRTSSGKREAESLTVLLEGYALLVEFPSVGRPLIACLVRRRRNDRLGISLWNQVIPDSARRTPAYNIVPGGFPAAAW